MIKGTLKNGFKFEVDPTNFIDDYEFFEALADIESEENPLKFIEVINIVLGEKQKKALIKHLKKKDPQGKARFTDMSNCIGEIFNRIQQENIEVKN